MLGKKIEPTEIMLRILVDRLLQPLIACLKEKKSIDQRGVSDLQEQRRTFLPVLHNPVERQNW